MNIKKRDVVIPKDKAVFWLDANGRWHNAHGTFKHPKIIKYFHSSIRKDEGGYYLYQESDTYREKVYFPYDDTALFVFKVVIQDSILLKLNTGLEIDLDPRQMFIQKDQLYLKYEDERIRFTDQSLLKLSKYLVMVDDQHFFNYNHQRVRIPNLDE
jgi:hypothetical protein